MIAPPDPLATGSGVRPHTPARARVPPDFSLSRGRPMPAPRTSPRLVLTVLAAAAASFSMLQSLVTPVLPTIQHDLVTSSSAITWILTAWLLSAAVATPLLGRVGDMLGKERTLVLSLAAIALGSLIAAVAPSLTLVLVGRVVQGLGGAAFPLSFGILRDEF